MLEADESLFEFHDDEISDPLSLTVSELKLFFLNVLPSLFTLGFGVGLLANTVLALLMDPHAWAFPVQPLCISVLSGVIIGTWYDPDGDRNDFSNGFCRLNDDILCFTFVYEEKKFILRKSLQTFLHIFTFCLLELVDQLSKMRENKY